MRKRLFKTMAATGIAACMLIGNGAIPFVQPYMIQAAIVDGDELVDGLSRAADYYILKDPSARDLTYNEIAGLGDSERQMAINEIYARHGRKFVIPQVQQYFNEKSWYQGTVEASKFDENVLSDIETGNISKLLKSTTSSEYVLDGSDHRYVTDAEVAALSKDDLQLAINEIYARHGRKFAMKMYQEYFDKCSWYQGTIEPAQFNESILNTYEISNIDKLSEAINQRSGNADESTIYFAGRYTMQNNGISVELSISLYSDPAFNQTSAGEEVGTIASTITFADGSVSTSTGYLYREDNNSYIISLGDLSGSKVTAFENCLILLGSGGFDDTYTLAERYQS